MNDLELKYENNVLSIRAHRAARATDALYSEFDAVLFQRTFTLPESYDAQAIEADLTGGVLKVTIPKEARRRSRVIKVNA